MELKKIHWIGIILSLLIMISSLFLIKTKLFFFIIGIGILTGALPFVFSIIYETKLSAEKEEMFLEFARNLVESVKTGVPINKSIINVRNKSYGVLSENVRKLANQIYLGIPLNTALQTFSKDVNNRVISRALTLIGQAERAGGDIGGILESVAEAVSMSDKLKKERKTTISTLVTQGYIIFFVFIIIILIMQFKIFPMLSGMSSAGMTGVGLGGGMREMSSAKISSSFVYLLLTQGFFTGLIIGKLAERNAKAGIKHSFILMLMSFLISAGANVAFG